MQEQPTYPAAPGVVPAEVRPPFAGDEAAPPSGAATRALPYRVLRPTAVPRDSVRPVVWNDHLATLGYPTDHGYVCRFWTAAIGRGAVADLIRLAVAAQRDRSLPRPVFLGVLVREGLVTTTGARLAVRKTVPPLSGDQVRRLPPPLRAEHAGLRFHQPHGRLLP